MPNVVVDQITHNLKEIIGNNQISDNVYNIFAFAEKAIQNKEVIIEINPEIDPEINKKMATMVAGGAYFRKNKQGDICLAFGQKYLDTYNQNSSFHYTIFIHECKHLYDYFQNKFSFFNSNEKERFQYELDAENVEAEFIKYYLAGKYNLSERENYILQSYERDNLESWTIRNRKQSADIYLFLNDLEVKYNHKTISKEQLIKELVQKADQLLAKADVFLNLLDVYNTNDKNIFSRYAHLIRMKTFFKYLGYMFEKEPELKEILIKNFEINNKLNMIISLIEQHDKANTLYSRGLEYWEEKW